MSASDPLVLGFDTSAAHCAAALLSGDRLIAARAEEMGRGQAERLMPMLEEMLAEAGVGWSDLDVLGVGTGPGNFTGLRIAVAAARGLALALDVPAVGVSGFEVIHSATDGPHLAVIPAPQGRVYAEAPGQAPILLSAGKAEATGLPPAALPAPAALAEAIARLAAARGGASDPPAPLYLRPPDAAPAREAPPVILDDA
ncbi:tRNA (adenosine(37)-N6)-threonylcarbamoyltransferase complex dimerization subunit type 1 TsaB [Rhodosalinus sp.]|uniref:tRNA (adenosine(37)-N6)-threonylcarbamoyltransferase complex dimerization subunit type 1 TsaB n=1 Tax=Rhodosalinus sp. TaxID=2047741 RepID=UPI0039794656